MTTITVTERGTFKRCRQKWDYESRGRQGLAAVKPPTALAFGRLVHQVHEAWLLKPDAQPADLVGRLGVTALDELKASYRATVGVEPEEAELDDFFEQTYLALEIFKNYKDHWGASLPDGYELIQPEQSIIVPIPGTEHFLEATLDALLRDQAGLLWVLERKTYGNRPRLEDLESNDQFLAYVWVLTQLDMGPVGGVLYDGMWKRAKEGKRGLDDLFIRHTLTWPPQALASFENDLRNEVEDMVNPRLYRNFRWEGCWDCSSRPLCLAEFRGEDADYVRETQFTKREDAVWQRPSSET